MSKTTTAAWYQTSYRSIIYLLSLTSLAPVKIVARKAKDHKQKWNTQLKK